MSESRFRLALRYKALQREIVFAQTCLAAAHMFAMNSGRAYGILFQVCAVIHNNLAGCHGYQGVFVQNRHPCDKQTRVEYSERESIPVFISNQLKYTKIKCEFKLLISSQTICD